MSVAGLLQGLESVAIEQLLGVAVISTLVSACTLMITFAWRRRSAAARVCVWQAACGAILAGTIVLLFAPGIPLRSARVVAPQPPEPRTMNPAPTFPVVEMTTQPAAPVVATPMTEQTEPNATAATALPVATAISPSHHPSNRNFPVLPWPIVLALGWIVIMMARLARFARSLVASHLIRRRAACARSPRVTRSLGEACRRVGARSVPQLLVSSDVSVPFTLGLVRPAIVLPVDSHRWTLEKLMMVFTHELAHIQRHDLIWQWIGNLATAIAWFNPLLWWASRRGTIDRERACDDVVIRSGVDAAAYGDCLVEIAASLSGRRCGAVGLSMAQPPLKQRLRWILLPTASRQGATPRLRTWLFALFLAAAVALGIVRPLASSPVMAEAAQNDSVQPKAQTESEADSNRITLTRPVVGEVTDDSGRPIVGAVVVVNLVDFGDENRRTYRETYIRKWRLVTDEKGAYTIDISDLGPQPPHYCFDAQQVKHPGYVQARGRHAPSVKDVSRGSRIRTIELSLGRRITGQLVAANGQPIGGIVKAAARPTTKSAWFAPGEAIPDSGALGLDLPPDADAELVIYAKGHAPKIVSVKKDLTNIGRIELSPGTTVSGQLRDLEDRPIAGAVIRLDAGSHELRGMFVSFSRTTKTDSEGNFELPPAAGSCRLSVMEEATIGDQIGNESIIGIVPPLVEPRTLELASERGTKQITLKEAETFMISGTALWDDDTPVENFQVKGGVMTADSGITISYARTDRNGRYQIRLPKNAVKAYLNGFGHYRDPERTVWYMAHGRVPGDDYQSQIVSISKLDRDLTGYDWQLRPHRARPPRTAAQKRAEEDYRKLEEESRQAQQKYAESPDRDDASDPRNLMAPVWLAYEELYRGDDHAVQAILQVLRSANSVGQPDWPVAKARNQMVDRMIDHYLGHKDLARTFRYLNGGPEVPRADTLLRLASGRSPHESVRAAALLARARRAKNDLRQLQRIDQLQQYVDSIKNAQALGGGPAIDHQAHARAMQRRLDRLRATGADEIRQQAHRWLDTIAGQYDSVPVGDPDGHTYGGDAKALRFAVDQVVVGAEAPELEATDTDGKRFRLSEHRGKLVVLCFHQDIFNSAEHLPHQSLLENFDAGEALMVTIVATPSERDFIKSVQQHWREGIVIWEPLHGPYQYRWGIEGFPTAFLVDPAGKLHMPKSEHHVVEADLRVLLEN